MSRRGLESLVVIALAVGLAIVLIEELSRPFAAIFALFAGASFYLALRPIGTGSAARVIAYNLGIVFVGIALVEGMSLRNAPRVDCEPELSDPHDVLGYAPLPSRRVACQKEHRGDTIYDAVYTLDASGWRLAPPVSNDPKGCVLFFGGSFTFGQGVNDAETMPYRVGVESAGRYQIYNFGFKGYGPHQMLAALESGWVGEQITCEPTHVVYQALSGHIQRVVGRTSWGSHAPMYRLDPQGGVAHAGRFDDRQSATRNFLERRLQRSALINRLRNSGAPPEVAETDLFLGIVAGSKAEVARRFPGAEFHVLMWDVGAEPLADAFDARGIAIHPVSDALPGLQPNGAPYRIHPKDPHPSARAHALIAEYVAAEVLR